MCVHAHLFRYTLKLFYMFLVQHNAFIVESKEREPEVLFLGDSLLADLQQTEVADNF